MAEPAGARHELVQGMAAALAGSRLGMLLTDARGCVERVNVALCARSGLAAVQLQGLALAELPLWTDGAAGLAEAVAAGQDWQGDLECRGLDARPLRVHAELAPLALPQQPLAGWLLLLHWEVEAPGTAQDPECGLPGAPVFRQVLRRRMSRAREQGRMLRLARIGVDQYRALHDRLGAAASARLMGDLAARLQSAVRRQDMLAWLGDGDEFLLLLDDAEGDAAPLQRLLAAAAAPASEADGVPQVTLSLGTACYPQDGELDDELLAATDAALALAQQQGGARIVQAAPRGPGGPGLGRHQLLADLSRALGAGELMLHYQPQLSLFSGEIVGVEALLRWDHPERGIISPSDFIPLAEESGLIIPISEWVLTQACSQAACWRAQGLPPIRMGVNLSARHFRLTDLLDTVRRTLQHCGLPSSGLDLELTESVMMHDLPAAIRAVDALKALGVRLSLDDFGTGWSSLAYLSRFAIDTLKIDRCFVRDVTGNTVNAAIVSATIAMAHKLGKSVIAEGVETEAQMHFLRGRECDEMQGFLFSPALPPTGLAACLARGDRIKLHGDAAPDAGENRLLLVDDEPNILTALRRLLRREGYAILTAADGAEALELLAHEPVQVIVSDQRMPGMSGTELLRRVKQLYPRTVRIALSGYADLATVTDAVNHGAIYRYLSKPWDDEALKGEIREAFRHWRGHADGGEGAPKRASP